MNTTVLRPKIEAPRQTVGPMPAWRWQTARPHLIAWLLACLITAGVLVALDMFALRQERAYIHALAPLVFDQKQVGIDLQRMAFRQPDLLPIYGSSELLAVDVPTHASNVFRKYPTGFTVFAVGKGGMPLLETLQALAAVGHDLRNKKVVISFTPGIFYDGVPDPSDAYAGNFSRLHAYELLFNSTLSLPTKRAIAKRMLDYPDTLKNDDLLKTAAEQLVNGSHESMANYDRVQPLGKLQVVLLEWQDRWESLLLTFDAQRHPVAILHEPGTPDWHALLVQSQRIYQSHTDNNPFGFDDQYWTDHSAELQQEQGKFPDASFLARLASDPNWGDLDLLLRTLQELGARPLLLSMPIHGGYYNYWGVSASARAAYYDKLSTAASPYGVPVVHFSDHDTDKYFLSDKWSHPSDKAWVYIDRALDAFEHGVSDSRQLQAIVQSIE